MIDITANDIKTRPPKPVLISAYDSAGHGGWYAGAKPANIDSKPVIVFVPGLGQPAKCFWDKNELYGTNELYARTFNDGFLTAFVGFKTDNEKAYDMWEDAKILTWQLKEICRYYKTGSVIIAAHSKGGIDAQTAIVYNGAAPMVKKLITLSSPHHGSQLADLAYSSVGWPLAELLGQHSKGNFCMQTGYMREFRKQTDRNKNNTVPIETLAGCGDGPVFTQIWASRQFLSIYGDNDGVVTVSSAQNPKGSHLGTLDLNHIQMSEGRYVWQHIKDAIYDKPLSLQGRAAAPARPCGVILRSGIGGFSDEFRIDSGVNSFEIDVAAMTISAVADAKMVLSGPGGITRSDFETHDSGTGLKLMRMTVDKTVVGAWRILSASGMPYLALIRLSGSFLVYPDEANEIGSEGQGINDLQSVTRVTKIYPDRIEVLCEHCMKPSDITPILNLENGFYNLETTVKGELKDGSLFERNVFHPLFAKSGK